MPTTYSDNTAIMAVMPTSQLNALQNPITAFSSSSSSSSCWSSTQIKITDYELSFATVGITLPLEIQKASDVFSTGKKCKQHMREA